MPTPYIPLHGKDTLPSYFKAASRPNRLRLRLTIIFSCISVAVLLYLAKYSPTKAFGGGSYVFDPSKATDSQVSRIQETAYGMSSGQRPECAWNSWHEQRYSSLQNAANVFLAVNFHNNEDVLPTFFQELPHLLEHLGLSRVYVSIYENGSGDRTPQMLSYLDELLNALDISHTVISYGAKAPTDKEDGKRITYLASVRNIAMEPLYSGKAAAVLDGAVDEVLWINDVFHCSADILEILYQKRHQGANQACATDWGVWGDQVVYDRWVLRPMSGRVPYHYDEIVDWFSHGYAAEEKLAHLPLLFPEDPEYRAKILEEHLPLQVFSYWNGATVFDAAAFLSPHNIRFRVSGSDLDEDGTPKTVTEKASECFLSSVDLWKHGLGRILLVPKASVAYTYDDYEVHRRDNILPSSHNSRSDLVNWIAEPPEEVAMQDFANWWGPERWGAWDEQ